MTWEVITLWLLAMPIAYDWLEFLETTKPRQCVWTLLWPVMSVAYTIGMVFGVAKGFKRGLAGKGRTP